MVQKLFLFLTLLFSHLHPLLSETFVREQNDGKVNSVFHNSVIV